MPENTTPNTHFPIPPIPVTPKPRRRFLKWFLLSLGAISFLLITAFFVILSYAEQRVFSGLTPEQRTCFDRWYSEKISIPPETLRVEPFTSQTLEAARTFDRLWTESGKAATELGSAWYSETKQSRTEPVGATASASPLKWRDQLTPFEPLMTAWRDVVKRPDYRTEVWYTPQILSPGDSFLDDGQRLFLAAQRVSRLVYLQTLIQIEENRFAEALEGADSLIASARMSLYPTMFLRMLAGVQMDYGLDAYVRIAANLTDPALQSQAYQTLQTHREQGIFLPELEGTLSDSVGMTWLVRYQGVTPDFQNKTGWEIVAESVRVQLVFLEEQVRPQAKSPERRQKVADYEKMLTSQLQSTQKDSSVWNRLSFGRVHRITMAMLYRIGLPSIEEMSKKETGFRRQYDLLLENLKGTSSFALE